LSFVAAGVGLVSDAGGVKAAEEGGKLAFKAAKLAEKTCGCFVEGTEVETPKGLVPIEEVKVGDQVLAYNEQTGQIVSESVTDLIRPEPKPTYSLIFKGDNGEADNFRATADHPWFTVDHKWVRTSDLKVGDKIETATGKAFTLAMITLSGKIEKTYNLEVNGLHTFLVGRDHLVVHNTICDPNKIAHIFDKAVHNLGPLVDKFGSKQAAATALNNAAQSLRGANEAALKQGLPVVIDGVRVIVRGVEINGVIRIGTAFIP